jgi:Na+-driven multidrug efflux pump
MKTTNHFAVVVAAIVFFMLGAGWYTVLADPWAAGVGKTMEQLKRESSGSFMPMVMGFVAILVMCYTLNSLLNRLGDTTAGGGAKVGAFIALGFVAANIALNYAFELRGVTLWTINTGYVLVGLTVAGAIIGGWRKKP